MYSTRPCCLVQAITRHTCLDPHLGSWNCLNPHCTQWVNKQHRPAGVVPSLPFPFIPTLIGLRAFDLVSSLVWWETLANSVFHCSSAFLFLIRVVVANMLTSLSHLSIEDTINLKIFLSPPALSWPSLYFAYFPSIWLKKTINSIYEIWLFFVSRVSISHQRQCSLNLLLSVFSLDYFF